MRVALCFLLLYSSSVLYGQSQPYNAAPPLLPAADLHLLRPYGDGCPVGMKAERQASGQREWIVSLEDATSSHHPLSTRPSGAGVRVDLVGSAGKAMRQAEVSVYYLASGVHVLQAAQHSATLSPASVLRKTFLLSGSGGEPDVHLAGNLLLADAASITQVRLLSIQYSDGTSWQTQRASNCVVEPGLLMVVTAGK